MTAGILYVTVNESSTPLLRGAIERTKKIMPKTPIGVITDIPCILKEKPADFVIEAPKDLQDYPPYPQRGLYAKPRCLNMTPFDLTLYLDTDTYLTKDVSDVFDLMQYFDLALAHETGRYGHDHIGPDCFPTMNCGVIAYHKRPITKKLFADWWDELRTTGAVFDDQRIFRKLSWAAQAQNLRLAILPPEYNLRFVFPVSIYGAVRILHGHCSGRYAEVAEKLNAQKYDRITCGERMFAHLEPGKGIVIP